MPPEKKVIYISGPMTGLPGWNYPAFHRAAAALREAGHQVMSPAENFRNGISWTDGEPYPMRDAFSVSTAFICREATHIALLPGWRRSKGVEIELGLARYLGLDVIELEIAPPC